MVDTDCTDACEVCGSTVPNVDCGCCWDGGYSEFMAGEYARWESAVMPAGMTVDSRRGSEGPRHDPYSYTEYQVTMPDGRRIVYHSGLGEELKVDGMEIMRGDACGAEFERLVGFGCDQIEYWVERRYDSPCMACGAERGCRGRCME